MRLLFVTPNPPSPIRVRPYHFVRALLARGHEVTVACPTAGQREREDAGALRAVGAGVVAVPLGRARRAANLLAALPAGVPLQARFAWHPALARAIDAAVAGARIAGRPFDAAHVEHLRASAYALRLRAGPPVVWDSVDCITDLFEQARAHARSRRGRLIAAVDLGRTRRYEAWLARRFGEVIVTSPRDREALLGLAGGRANVTVIPNGVDLDTAAPGGSTGAAARDSATILFSGKLSYHANVTAARHLVEDVMPHVWAARPDARVVLAGAEPAREVLALAAARPDRVTVTGFVPDLRPYLRRATVAAAPMVYAVGIQNKVLEAMAAVTPVVATPVAARALAARAGRDLLVADDPPRFARAVLDLVTDPARAAAVGAAGRAYVEGYHDWDGVAARLESVYRRAIERAAGAPVAETAGAGEPLDLSGAAPRGVPG